MWCNGSTTAFQAVGTGSIPAIRSTGGGFPGYTFSSFLEKDGPERREVPGSGERNSCIRKAAAGREDITDCHGLRPAAEPKKIRRQTSPEDARPRDDNEERGAAACGTRRPRVWPPYENRRVIGAIGSAPGS